MTAIVVLSAQALPLAQRLRAVLPGAEVHGLVGRVSEAEVSFADTMGHLRGLFAAGRTIIGLCAAGILIRAVAPLLADKHQEPPVLAVGDGAVVPLLGGHHGANALARRIAAALDLCAAVTTAGDGAFGIALDEPPAGWTVTNPGAVKAVTAALLAGEPVGLTVEAGDAAWLKAAPFRESGRLSVRVTDRFAEAGDGLILHPPVLAVGVGCERNASAEELTGLVRDALAAQGLAEGAVACVVSVDAKADEPAVHAVAAALGVPARFFPPAALEAEAPRLVNPSEVVFREIGCHGVAEGAALAAVGATGRLIQPKLKSARCTCAIARAEACLDPTTIGRARGSLTVVGIGPGTPDWRTPQATRAIAEAEDLVGYALYLDLLGEAAAGKRRHHSALGAEEDRVRVALDLAAEGRRVALVCSGDPGIYALATLVFELMERQRRADWDRLEVSVVPGLSAMQAAAARIGAPLNHDFCAISLSDLLTPWPMIEKRLHAAAEADFVVAFYNPVSQRRRDQLAKARDILLTGRPATTPVVLARNLGRSGETVEVTSLGALAVDQVDMLTMVLVGSSDSRLTRSGRVFTPRGYAAKMRD
jgi:cobalt-precorrin 5A hydrolase/precorrin-3B C17-methyltransferase